MLHTSKLWQIVGSNIDTIVALENSGRDWQKSHENELSSYNSFYNFVIISVSEDGLLEGAEDVFIGVKKAEDYHSEMNGLHFEDYVR